MSNGSFAVLKLTLKKAIERRVKIKDINTIVSNEGRARIKHMTNRRANESVKKRLHKH
jgi:hypothetical protein